MRSIYTHKILTYFIGLIWLVNGLVCKVLNLVPRHEQIVARILGGRYSRTLTVAIGLSEIGMAVWALSGIKSRYNAILQMTVVGTMNILEFFLVPDLLLWGRLNALFACLFVLTIYYTEFKLNPHQT
ncbi:DoxX-like family protein [Chitinophaga ginsengisoli]|uniref:DoxX-like protein n=1 Tax=Chitinophaga ginsengisoli TaxID=363837 RepID=A0A2P8G4Y5_9BACT|nr:DoxX-like family protein [Chitinophaga ginsengisoli]PSL29027.1 DoxX-like protein [Chitinophaga ginsengisoli]